MKIYLVRHGESEGNVRDIYQHPTELLTENGKNQAKVVAKRFETINFDLIVTSPNTRAHETALEINNISQQPLIVSPLFIEKYGSTQLYGLGKKDEKAKNISAELSDNFHDPNYRHSDEETFFECRDRAKVALQFLIDQKKESVVVVTHGTFMKTMLGVMLFGDKFSSYDYLRFKHFFIAKNTGITLCVYNDEEGWGLHTWNDHSHLG